MDCLPCRAKLSIYLFWDIYKGGGWVSIMTTQTNWRVNMKHYFIEYETEYGSATFEGEYSDYNTFIAEANKLAHESGILDSDESVLDCMVECYHD